MDDKLVKSEIKSLNNLLYDNDLSIDELAKLRLKPSRERRVAWDGRMM